LISVADPVAPLFWPLRFFLVSEVATTKVESWDPARS
jgi:hypothetical protein